MFSRIEHSDPIGQIKNGEAAANVQGEAVAPAQAMVGSTCVMLRTPGSSWRVSCGALLAPTATFTAPPSPLCDFDATGSSWGSEGAPNEFVAVPAAMQTLDYLKAPK